MSHVSVGCLQPRTRLYPSKAEYPLQTAVMFGLLFWQASPAGRIIDNTIERTTYLWLGPQLEPQAHIAEMPDIGVFEANVIWGIQAQLASMQGSLDLLIKNTENEKKSAVKYQRKCCLILLIIV